MLPRLIQFVYLKLSLPTRGSATGCTTTLSGSSRTVPPCSTRIRIVKRLGPDGAPSRRQRSASVSAGDGMTVDDSGSSTSNTSNGARRATCGLSPGFFSRKPRTPVLRFTGTARILYHSPLTIGAENASGTPGMSPFSRTLTSITPLTGTSISSSRSTPSTLESA